MNYKKKINQEKDKSLEIIKEEKEKIEKEKK